MNTEVVLLKQLEELKEQHRQLDHEIRCAEQDPLHNQLMAARLKKQKLGLRDQMAALEMALYPDVPA
jgi:hypothetical protein